MTRRQYHWYQEKQTEGQMMVADIVSYLEECWNVALD